MAFRFHVVKIELDREKVTFSELGVKIGHERRLHSLTCAMSEDDGGAVGPRFGLYDFQ